MAAKAEDPRQRAALEAAAAARKRARLINALEITVHVDDQTWTWRGGETTALHADLLRQQVRGNTWVDPTWHAVNYLVVNAPHAPADVVAKIVYLARLQAGERPTLDEVLDSIPFGAAIWAELPDTVPDLEDGEVAFPDPPSSGGSSDE